MRTEIRISGFGGQGVGLAGYILGRALALYDDLEAVMTQSYGPEARGGSSSSDVVLSDRLIAYPFVMQPDVLVALSQEAYTKSHLLVKPAGLVMIDQDLVQTEDNASAYAIPSTRMAEELGRRIVTNMVMLGFFTGITGLVSQGAMIKAIEISVKAKTVPLNLQAFDLGYEYVLAHYPSAHLLMAGQVKRVGETDELESSTERES